MRSLHYTRPGLDLLDVPEPALESPTGVKIEIAYASLCGTDLHILSGDFDAILGDAPLVPLGHEASGTVLELGPAATAKGLRVGDPVTFYFNRYCGACHYCRTGREQFCTDVVATMNFMSDVVVLDEQQVFPLPAGSDLLAASLIEPASVALRGVDLARIEPGATVAVSGGGGIGQIVARLARLSGATSLTLIEPVADKREVAARTVDHVIDPIGEDAAARALEITDGRGFDVVIETSGSAPSIGTAMAIAGRGSTVVYLATYKPGLELTVPMGTAFLNEITVVTGVYQSPYLFPRTVALHAGLDLAGLTTVFAPEAYEEAFAAQRSGSSIKSVFGFARSGRPTPALSEPHALASR